LPPVSRIVDTIRRDAPDAADATSRAEREGRTGDPEVGVVQYFHLGDRETVERVVAGLERLPVRNLRTAISWCDWTMPGGEEWYAWLLPQLVERFDVLPCFLYTPPALGLLPKTSSPPRDPADYGRFVEMVLRRHEGYFAHVELWNEPNNYIEWDWTVDPEWVIFAEMVGGAAERAATLGVRSVLGGMSPFDPNWLDLMFKRGALEHVDVIGVHGFPGTWEAVWEGWDVHIDRVQEVLDRHGSRARVWVTEAGFSTWAHDEFRQLTTMRDLAAAPADRVYWYSVEDLAPERETLDGFHCDERAYHFGLQRRSGRPKLLARVLAERGLDGVRELVRFGSGSVERSGAGRTLVTGGVGFVGTNLVERLASEGTPVTILDSLVRPGAEEGLRRLKQRHGDLVAVDVGDVRDVFALRRCLAGAERVFHLAARDASADGGAPTDDLEINLRGTVNLLEEARRLEQPPPIVFASTSLVYGEGDPPALAFSTPYGCAKGAADQYVLDYARGFGLRTCSLRIGAVYGPYQTGAEEQGWAARLMLAALAGRPLELEGDGMEVRDLLYVDDLVEALLAAAASEEALSGRAFDVGGGSERAAALVEVVELLGELVGRPLEVRAGPARPGVRRSYVTDVAPFAALTGWRPETPLAEGLARLREWLEHGAAPAAAAS
jgi:CDP-paratose 2-epimerase